MTVESLELLFFESFILLETMAGPGLACFSLSPGVYLLLSSMAKTSSSAPLFVAPLIGGKVPSLRSSSSLLTTLID